MATGTPQPLWRGVIMLLMLHGRIHATIVYDVITCFVPAKPYNGARIPGRTRLMMLGLHTMITFQFVFSMMGGGEMWRVPQSSHKYQWDRCAILDPRRCREFQQALATLPIPSWNVHVNNHAEQFQQDIMQLARQHFAKTTRERPRPRLSEPTLALIQLKRSVLDFRAQDCLHEPDIKAELKALEKLARIKVQEDQSRFYDEFVGQLAQDGALHDFRSVYQLLSRLGGRPRHKTGAGRLLPLLKDSDGKPVTSFLQQQRLWLRHFASSIL